MIAEITACSLSISSLSVTISVGRSITGATVVGGVITVGAAVVDGVITVGAAVVDGAVVEGTVVTTAGFVVDGTVVVTLLGVTAVVPGAFVLPDVVLVFGNVEINTVLCSSFSVSCLLVALVSADSITIASSIIGLSVDGVSLFVSLRSHEARAMHRIAVANNATTVCQNFIYSVSSFFQ